MSGLLAGKILLDSHGFLSFFLFFWSEILGLGLKRTQYYGWMNGRMDGRMDGGKVN